MRKALILVLLVAGCLSGCSDVVFAAGVDVPALMETIIAAESSGRAGAVGDGGKARGLCQIQRATWERYTSASWDRAFDPALNRQVGEKIVRDIVKRYGNRATRAMVIYTYNTGRFVKAGGNLPSWTRNHPNRIYRGVFINERG